MKKPTHMRIPCESTFHSCLDTSSPRFYMRSYYSAPYDIPLSVLHRIALTNFTLKHYLHT